MKIWERRDMGLTKAKLAVELKEYNRVSRRVADIGKLLEEQCEAVYGHDFGPDNTKSFCEHCDMLNMALLDEAEEVR